MNSKDNMTAVEWFANELYEKFEMRGDGILYNELFKQAKQMEKEQIIEANENKMPFISGNEYYNETFKSE